MNIRTILCPVDFSALSARALEAAVEVARAFRGRLVLHYNRMAVAPGLSRAWDWESTHYRECLPEAEAERQMQDALAAVPASVVAEGVISAGPVGLVVLSLAERLPADLIVIGSHGWSTLEHASVTERVIAKTPCPVLCLHEGRQEPLRLAAEAGAAAPRAVVPTDFSPTAQHAVRYACALAHELPIHLELLHVLGESHRTESAERAARERLDAAVPRELRGRASSCVRHGQPTTEILSHLRAMRPQFAILGEHARDVWRRLFTPDTTRAIMHEAGCPVWIVPRASAGVVRPGGPTHTRSDA